ncbi:sigma-70 family RNA polymerase sigma factor [Ruminococcus sp. Marseille-P6503]|uniref:RNA polymerase sigma factor n=1 Tax=Ruminococcus sp. Marseille-P6503 TaxID=2364796 RepID=UPI000F53E962|nr:sigma-70 family RNA polymerase sigma factor [Ruminococcus sp. Marseille-P6503]
MLGSYLVLIDSEDDKKAFESFYEENCGKMFAVAYNICRNSSLSEDAVADAFLGIARTFSTFSKLNEEDKIPYLIRAVKNSALNVAKRESSSSQHTSLEMIIPDDEPFVDFFEQADFNELVNAIKALDERYKTALTYKVYYNMSIDEIAAVMCVSKRTVSYYLKKAREEISENIGSV